MWQASSQGDVGPGRRPALPRSVGHLTNLLHASVSIISISLCVLLYDSSLFAWHPIGMTLGFLLFMTEGVMAAILFRHIEPGPDRLRAIWSHALLQLRAVLCISGGFSVIFYNKMIHNKLHFQSTHAKWGLATLVLSTLAPLGGILSFRKLGLINRFPEQWQSYIKMIGLVTWLCALVTIELALPHEAVNKGTLTLFERVGVAGMGVLMLLLNSKNARAKEAADNLGSKAV